MRGNTYFLKHTLYNTLLEKETLYILNQKKKKKKKKKKKGKKKKCYLYIQGKITLNRSNNLHIVFYI